MEPATTSNDVRASEAIRCAFDSDSLGVWAIGANADGTRGRSVGPCLHLADLYNWADAAPEFAEAEALFSSAGDRRNALYARLGRIRANIERDQRGWPEVSSQLANELRDNSLL